jgi:cystathionine beta-lyase family protein involved in aluminum resistance
MLQGLFLAPAAVATALKVAVYAASVFGRLGYEVRPGPASKRGDLVQAIRLGSRSRVEGFCRAVQSMSPVDSRAVPEFAALPGYHHRVIMAAGTFVQGASLELSADAPDREPYWVFLQGGLGLGYGKAAVEAAAQAVAASSGTSKGTSSGTSTGTSKGTSSGTSTGTSSGCKA